MSSELFKPYQGGIPPCVLDGEFLMEATRCDIKYDDQKAAFQPVRKSLPIRLEGRSLW